MAKFAEMGPRVMYMELVFRAGWCETHWCTIWQIVPDDVYVHGG
jgi:hypothetical protein